MDILQDYALQAYKLYLSADPYLTPIRRALSTIYTQTAPLLSPLTDKLSTLAHESPAIVTIGVFILLLLIALQILNLVRRIMMFWVAIVMRLLFWGVVVAVVAVVVQRGVGRTVEDLRGWGGEVGEVWWREYRKWDGAMNNGNSGKVSTGYGGGANAGRRRNWS